MIGFDGGAVGDLVEAIVVGCRSGGNGWWLANAIERDQGKLLRAPTDGEPLRMKMPTLRAVVVAAARSPAGGAAEWRFRGRARSAQRRLTHSNDATPTQQPSCRRAQSLC